MSSKFEFVQQSSLSQQLADKDGDYSTLAGSDPRTSQTIGRLLVLARHGLIDLEDPAIKLVVDLLNMRRKALFATSERVNEITKMGMQMPRGEDIVGLD